jgi:hypothetical protein
MDMEDWVWICRFHNFVYLHHHFKTESQEATHNKEIKEKQVVMLFWQIYNITR